jgi:hypothetical protein
MTCQAFSNSSYKPFSFLLEWIVGFVEIVVSRWCYVEMWWCLCDYIKKPTLVFASVG